VELPPRTAAVTSLPQGLFSVSAAPATQQGWAAGERFAGSGQGFVGYLVHFTGLSWKMAVTFKPGIHLDGVSAASGRTAWVWGYDQAGPHVTSERPFLAQVTGNVVREAHPTMLSGIYVRVLASAGAADTWIVGGAKERSRSHGLVVARWDGTSWRSVPAPPGISQVTWLSTSGPSDTWIAAPAGGKLWLLHWNGTAWSRSYTPPAGAFRGHSFPSLLTVASAPGHAWAAYTDVTDTDPTSGTPFSAYFNGSTWNPVPVPTAFSSLTDITITGTDAWATGDLATHTPRILHSRHGGAWCVQPLSLPRSKGCSPRPTAVSAASPTYVIAVSSLSSVGCRRSLAYVYDGHTWRSVSGQVRSR
jgi:hypothetical protein